MFLRETFFLLSFCRGTVQLVFPIHLRPKRHLLVKFGTTHPFANRNIHLLKIQFQIYPEDMENKKQNQQGQKQMSVLFMKFKKWH